VVALFSCLQIVGTTDNLATNACGLPFGTTTCAECANANCCAESTRCAADPTNVCSLYEGCLGRCNGDPECRSTCTTDYLLPANGSEPVSALSSCLASKCESECGLNCGGFAAYLSPPGTAASCQSCLEAEADHCTYGRSCATSTACDAFWRCWLACPTYQCQSACIASNDAGATLFRPLYEDFSVGCADSCGFGRYWSCAGPAKSPSTEPTTVKLTEWVYDYYGGGGVAGAEVYVCPSCPCTESEALDHQPTDKSGHVTLNFRQVGGKSPQCLQTTAPGYVTTLGYSSIPYTEPVLSIDNSLLPKTAFGIALVSNARADAGTPNVVAVGMFDCLFDPAPGVDISIRVIPSSALMVPDLDAGADAPAQTAPGSEDAGPWTADAETGIVANGGGGRVIFSGVPPGTGTLTATVPGVGIVSQVAITVVAGATIQVGMMPAPTP
jgi:hypothetical protein